jgi:response regulator RpfG family c-di-GMP phosphodiesterase
LIVLDYKLGDLSAEEVAAKIKEKDSCARILLTSAYEMGSPQITKLFETGLVDFQLRKPFGLEEFKDKIVQIIGH